VTRPRTAALAVALALLAAAVAVLVYQHNTGWMYDAKVYRTGGWAALHGLDVYRDVPPAFTYTPFAALLFAPLTLLPLNGIGFVLTAVSVLCLEASVWLALPRDARRWALWLPASALAIWLDPVSLTLLLGQVNLVLVLLVLLDLSLPDGSRWKGVGTGLATAIKLTPAFFVVYLALTRRFRAAAVAGGTFAATVAAGFAVLPTDALRYWGGTFLDSTRVGLPQNVRSQSLRSLVVRWAHTTQGVTPVWAVLAVAAAAAALWLAARAHRRGDELLAVCVCATATLLVSPITWQHHWVWMVPFLLWLLARAWQARSWPLGGLAAAIAVEFAVRPYQWGIPVDPAADLHLGVPQLLQSSTYGLTAVLLLAVAGLALHQTSTPPVRTGGRPRAAVRYRTMRSCPGEGPATTVPTPSADSSAAVRVRSSGESGTDPPESSAVSVVWSGDGGEPRLGPGTKASPSGIRKE
jgi:alpha-1,2-mannosyltransferase